MLARDDGGKAGVLHVSVLGKCRRIVDICRLKSYNIKLSSALMASMLIRSAPLATLGSECLNKDLTTRSRGGAGGGPMLAVTQPRIRGPLLDCFLFPRTSK